MKRKVLAVLTAAGVLGIAGTALADININIKTDGVKFRPVAKTQTQLPPEPPEFRSRDMRNRPPEPPSGFQSRDMKGRPPMPPKDGKDGKRPPMSGDRQPPPKPRSDDRKPPERPKF